MDAWLNTPYITVIVDFKYQIKLILTIKHKCMFKIDFININSD